MHLMAPSFFEFVQGSEKSHLYAPPTQVADVCCTIMTGAVFKSLVEGHLLLFAPVSYNGYRYRAPYILSTWLKA
jgi:hypothetical protein